MALPAFVHHNGHGVWTIDTGFQRDDFDAAYLIVRNGEAAFVDTGTAFAVPRLLQALQTAGLAPEAVRWVIPTHVHLDHAGGVGQLMEALPQAQLLVHPRGARHLIDPTRLWAGATAVYGPEEMARSYGALRPVPSGRVVASSDGQLVSLGRSTLRLIDTPGHARHHHCIWDEDSRGWFTGDTFGLSYREFDTDAGAWILPTSTPVQFEPEPLRQSVQRLLDAQPDCVYLTHYGRLGNVPRLGRLMLGLLEGVEAIGERLRQADNRHEALKAELLSLYLASLAEHGCTLPRERVADLLAIDLELNAQGMAVWLDRG